jgi:hypothetical protein
LSKIFFAFFFPPDLKILGFLLPLFPLKGKRRKGKFYYLYENKLVLDGV